jgi:ATP-dependent helicase YprA (DUF1998 family)
MMLELVRQEAERDIEINKPFRNLRYLVFDELHTSRGRQGSDVSILIRRIKSAASNPMLVLGTSATMVSGDATTILEQKRKSGRSSINHFWYWTYNQTRWLTSTLLEV